MTEPLAALLTRVAHDAPTPIEAPVGRGRLLGRDIGFPIGIAASAATRTPRLIEYFAARGFNVLTVKTVRSRAWTAYGGPVWVHLDDHGQPLGAQEAARDVADRTPACGSPDTDVDGARDFSDANSVGVPSPDPAVWQEELAAALRSVRSDQLVIASVQGSPEVSPDRESLVADFVAVARLAAEAGAMAVELNLSCPNVLDARGAVARPLCESPALVADVVGAVSAGLRNDVRLVAKLSYLPAERLEAVLAPILEHCHAVAGINTFPARVLDRSGEPLFRGVERDGEPSVRRVAGLSGAALRELARDFVRSVVALRGGRPLEIIAMGGVMGPEDVRALLELGADAVQSVTAAAHDPGLAAEVARALVAPVTA